MAPLHDAVVWDHREIAAFLIDHGAQLDIKDHYDQTPLHYAAGSASDNLGFIELLIKKGANVNSRDGKGRTPLTMAEQRGRKANADFLRRHGGKK